MTTIAEALAEFATDSISGSDDALLHRMQTYALDTLAVTLAGTVADSSKAVVETMLSGCGKAEATIMGCGRVTSAWDAALANGACAHALELDDDHRIAVLHPGAVVFPAALAAAEAEQASGRTFLRAALVGYEVMCRLGEVYRGKLFYHALHPTALCGVFGAAAAAASAMALDRNGFVRALGIAGTQASGLTEWRADGSWIKRLHPGRAAHSGILAARLARAGFTGPATIFEGPGGFFNAFTQGEEIDRGAMLRGLGDDYRALGTAVKPFPCCRFGHGAIDLALEARAHGIDPRKLESIAIRIYRTEVLTYHPRPASLVDAQFNLPYMVATALLKGAVRLSDFSHAAINDPEVLAIAARIDVVEDDEYGARYPDQYPVELVVRLQDGARHRFFSDCPSGDPQAARYQSTPEAFHGEAAGKVHALMEECGFGDRAARLAETVAALPHAANLDELCAVLGAPAKHAP